MALEHCYFHAVFVEVLGDVMATVACSYYDQFLFIYISRAGSVLMLAALLGLSGEGVLIWEGGNLGLASLTCTEHDVVRRKGAGTTIVTFQVDGPGFCVW
jgi:hypothetical protein